MAHQPDSTVVEAVVQLLCENGSMAEVVRILLNEAMKLAGPRLAVRCFPS